MENLTEGKLYDFHFKAWAFEMNELEVMIKMTDVPYEIAGEKFIFENVKYHKTQELQAISNANKSMFFIDAEREGCSVEYNFKSKKGMFEPELLEKLNYFLVLMEKKNRIDAFIINPNRIEIMGYDWEFKITPNSTKTKTTESTFASNVILMILKKHYQDSFKLSLKNDFDTDVLSSMKYTNKWLKSHLKLSQNDVVNSRKA